MNRLGFALFLLFSVGCGEEPGEPTPSPTGTPTAVNGTCVAHGDLFTDEYSCTTVQGPTPESTDPASSKVTNPDPDRLTDPDIEWMTEELFACSCICCHINTGAGGYVWSAEFEPVFTDSISDDLLLRFIGPPPVAGNGIPPEDNHGFDREETGIPTTDAARMKAYIDREITRRGI